MFDDFRARLRRHELFVILLFLFVSFRVLAILLLRPGGFIADTSDYDFYMAWGETLAMGYRPFDTLWSVYPPLFAAIVLPVFEWSSRMAPWLEPRLAFHTAFGLVLLLFETGNLLLIHRLAAKVTPAVADGALAGADRAALLYALLFVPLYTLLGWFESIPLFFLLLSLLLLLEPWPGSWAGSAVAAALGFLTKLTPVVMIPIAVRRLGAKLSWPAARQEWFNRRSPGNLLRPTLYVLFFLLAVVAVAYPIVQANPMLGLSSLRINALRPPWQSVWALLDGYYGFGLVPLDIRNLPGLEGPLWESRLPWGWITAAFLALYLWLYTRPYAWEAPRTVVGFTAVSLVWLLLYSKGWSPQFLVWVMAFVVLLMPNLWGMALITTLTGLNAIEAYGYLVLLPDERWILVTTVLLRTGLLVAVGVAFLADIWTGRAGPRLHRAGLWSGGLLMALTVVLVVAGWPRAATAYQERRLAEHPCGPAITYLAEQAPWPNGAILTEELAVWRGFHPWLHREYTIRVVDDYSPVDAPAEEVIPQRLDALDLQGEFWWVEWQEESVAARTYFTRPDLHLLDELEMGACTLLRMARLDPAQPSATVETAGGPIELLAATRGPVEVGATLHLVLYWKAVNPVETSYTVFTQVLDAADGMVAQQDNLPVTGLAPTDTWRPGVVVRDPYALPLPDDLPPGRYRLILGMYDADGRQVVRLPDGTRMDHVPFTLVIPSDGDAILGAGSE